MQRHINLTSKHYKIMSDTFHRLAARAKTGKTSSQPGVKRQSLVDKTKALIYSDLATA